MHSTTDAFSAIGESYMKILHADLSDGTYEIIKWSKDEAAEKQRLEPHIADWLKNVALLGQVHEEDISLYLTYTDINFIKQYFEEHYTPHCIRYRRKVDEGYRWTMMEIVKSKEYGEDCKQVYLFVRDIEDAFSKESQKYRELEKITSMDPLTGINNQYAFRRMCVLFEKPMRTISVGLVYADLNGLKNVNDTQGHEAGDDFIRAFADKIREYHLAQYAYRIGGDEFLIVFHDISEAEMQEQIKGLLEWNDSLMVPAASIGIVWADHTDDIYELMNEAERKMYERKHSLYELHPEYSREAVNRRYSEEMTAVVMNLSEMYMTLGVVDMVEETYRLIKFDSSINYTPPIRSFREYIDDFLNKLLTPDSKKKMQKHASIEALRKALIKNDTISFDYQMRNGAWRQVTYRRVEVKDGVLTKAIFYSRGLNRFMSEQMNERQILDEESEILEGIHREYILMCLINSVSGASHVYKSNGLPTEIEQIINSSHYVDAIAWYAKKYVATKDYEMFRKAVDMEHILTELEKEPTYHVIYHSKPSLHNTERNSLSEMIFSRASAQSENIVLVTRLLDSDEDKEEEEKRNQILLAMGDDFKSIFHVDFVHKQLTPYRMNYRMPASFWNYVATNPSYEEVMDAYIEEWVVLEDKAWVREQTSIANLRRVLQNKTAYSCEHRVMNEGKTLWYRMKVVNLAERDELTQIAVGFADITEEKMSYMEYFDNLTQNLFGGQHTVEDDEYLRKVLERDALTGLYNKEFFFSYANNVIQSNPDTEYVIHVSNIENFKLLNEKYGTQIGDDVLKTMAHLEAKMIPHYVLGGRLDGDRFVCLRENKNVHIDVEQKLMQQMASLLSVPNITLKSGFYKVDKEETVQLMCDRATIALERIKGKFGVDAVEYNDDVHQELLREQMILENMREALRMHQFEVYYQPKHDMSINATGGAEALIRWTHPDLGFMNPGIFIPLFEKNGFITSVDLYVLEEVCKCLYVRYSMGKAVVPISVNLSRRDLEQKDLVRQIVRIVDRYGIDHNLIHFEVTESAYSDDVEQITRSIAKLHDLGFVIELDDFGVGYSSITMLNSLDLDIMKLDISIVRNDVPGSEKNVLEFAMQLADLVGLQTVAEGVETEEQMKRLRSLGCDYIQGYYYARPMPREQFEAYIDSEL